MTELQAADAGRGTIHLNPATITLNHDPLGKLRATIEGKTYPSVKPLRAFPLTAHRGWIFLLDEEDNEIGVIDAIDALSAESREALESELELVYFSTQITRIIDVKSRHGVTTWELATERGEKTVHIKDRGDIRRLPSGQVIFADVYGMKYEIADMARMDQRSRDFIDTDT